MVKYYKKDGTRMVETEADDQEVCEVRMALEEYREIKKERDKAAQDRAYQYGLKKTAYEMIDEKDRQLENEKKENDRKDSVIQDLGSEIDSLNEQVWKLEAELQSEKKLNKNMIRIMREKANKERELQNPRKHDGYVVLQMDQTMSQQQYFLSYEEYSAMSKEFKAVNDYPCYIRRNVMVWKTRIQSFYSISLPYDSIKTRILDDLFQGGLLKKMGCICMIQHEADNGTYTSFDGYNGMFGWTYKANMKTRLWEVEIMTTGPLQIMDINPESEKTI